MKHVEERIARYLKEVEENDKTDEQRKDDGAEAGRLKERIGKLEAKRQLYLRVGDVEVFKALPGVPLNLPNV